VLETRIEPVDSPGALSVIYAALDELARRYGPGADAEHLELGEMTPPRGLFVVAREEAHIAGGVGVRTILEPARHIGEVKRLWVRPDLRRAGVGAALMRAVVEGARDLGFVDLYLETGFRQPEAIAFYPRIGWEAAEELPEGAHSYPGAYRFHLSL
jgi:GNAT superfamily N-acetyltransferase